MNKEIEILNKWTLTDHQRDWLTNPNDPPDTLSMNKQSLLELIETDNTGADWKSVIKRINGMKDNTTFVV